MKRDTLQTKIVIVLTKTGSEDDRTKSREVSAESGPRKCADPFLFYSIDENRKSIMKHQPLDLNGSKTSTMIKRKTRLSTETDLLNMLVEDGWSGRLRLPRE